MKLAPGMIVKTSYGTGPYKIKSILRACTCPLALEKLNNPMSAAQTQPHIHLVCEWADGRTKGEFYLNQFDEQTMTAIWPPYDTIEIVPSGQPVQLELL